VVASRRRTGDAGGETPRLNPLHCGAVVASRWIGRGGPRPRPVSIPFIAGQWSLQVWRADPGRLLVMSQSPSLRGSGRFTALVGGSALAVWSQSPSLRGSGRFGVRPVRGGRRGAGLNPLHCGAVVASRPAARRARAKEEVSIPFIAGQWSLPTEALLAALSRDESQSPSLRGSGRFSAEPPAARHGGAPVSIPFIAGQWSLPGVSASARRTRADPSQSPSLRGSGRFR